MLRCELCDNKSLKRPLRGWCELGDKKSWDENLKAIKMKGLNEIEMGFINMIVMHNMQIAITISKDVDNGLNMLG